MSNPMAAGGNGCGVCRARAGSPEAISADDDVVDYSALRRYYYFGVAYYDVPRIECIIVCYTTAGRPRRWRFVLCDDYNFFECDFGNRHTIYQ